MKLQWTNSNLVIVTGGPGTGKTTALLELEKRGIRHAPEVARQIIREQVEAGSSALPWADREAYTRLMLQRSVESFRAHCAVSDLTFADRGLPDTLAYARLIGLKEAGRIERACRRYRYAPVVFVAPPWEAIYRTDSERKQAYEEVRRTHEHVVETYLQCGYELIELPRMSPASRAQFMLEVLRLRQN
ncbi:MAG: AAA family ATPase [Acidobacteria bacterium]|nr:AAA family ATPase [Acidobacteriota bacterium]